MADFIWNGIGGYRYPVVYPLKASGVRHHLLLDPFIHTRGPSDEMGMMHEQLESEFSKCYVYRVTALFVTPLGILYLELSVYLP